MSKPKGSGSPLRPPDDPLTNFTLRVGVKELEGWRVEAKEMGLSLGSFVRAAVRDTLDELKG